MLADVTIDGMVEEEFRHAIVTLLREGNAGHAAKWLKSRLEPVCGDGLQLPARFLTVTPADVVVTGWSDIANRIERLEALGSIVTAVSIDLSDPGHLGLAPDASGLMAPHIETHFYTDDAWPFSRCDRAGMLVGYERGVSRWTGHFAEVDDTIGIEGIDDLYGAVLALEQACRPGGGASDMQHRAYMLGASYVAVLVHLAVLGTVLEQGLPRRLAVLVGSNESYPFFDAPVIAAPEAVAGDPPLAEAFTHAEPEQGYPLAGSRELAEPDADLRQEQEGWTPPPEESHISGTQLRRRVVTEQSIGELEAARKPSLLQRLLGRR
ncbi:MAG TPA: hypothetical protein VJQ77_03780 [Novosphingobium sp.]|nr:hypothetical protein [Novosphingobium sp.]